MAKRKIDSLSSNVLSDSDEDEKPRAREEVLVHRSMHTDWDGLTHTSTRIVTVPASPSKRQPQRDLLEADREPITDSWEATGGPFPFAQEENFPFDEGHPLDTGPRAPRDSVRFFSVNFRFALLKAFYLFRTILCANGYRDIGIPSSMNSCGWKAGEIIVTRRSVQTAQYPWQRPSIAAKTATRRLCSARRAW